LICGSRLAVRYFKIIGNHQILFGNVVSIYNVVTPMKESTHPLRDGAAYLICSATSALTTRGNAATLESFDLVKLLDSGERSVGRENHGED
jgi:hypothetical protein